MHQKTRTALYSAAICACIISAAIAVILNINAHAQRQKNEVTAVEETEEEAQEEKQPGHGPRHHQRRNRGPRGEHRGDVTRLLPDSEDFGQVPTPEEFEEELIKGLEEYRSLPPEERFRLNQQMHQTVLFVRSGLEMMRENIGEIPTDELIRIRDEFDEFSDVANQTFFSGIVEQNLITEEERATIGAFVEAMRDAMDECQIILHNG